MTTDKIYDRILALLADETQLSPEELTPEKSIKNDIGFDSTDVVAFICDIEELLQEYEVEVSDDDLFTIDKIGDIKTLIDKKLADK